MKINLLIAEDDMDDQLLIKTAFRDLALDADMRFVPNGVELIHHLHQSEVLPTHLLLDLNMPKMNGLETLCYLKSQDKFRHIPVMMFSTSNNAGDKFNCLQNGADIYFVKPELYTDWKATVHDVYSFCSRNHSCIPDSLKQVPVMVPFGRLWLRKC